MNIGLAIAVAGATISTLLGGIGSAIGITIANKAASGVMSEDPEKFGKLLVLIALPGTQGFYAFLGGFYVIIKTNLLGGGMPIDIATGLMLFFAVLPVGVVGLVSAIYQGISSAAGIYVIAKKPDEVGKAMILPAMVETYAVLGLLATILFLTGIKVG